MPITGSMLNIHYGGRLVRDTRPELMPFRLPLSLRGRISFARAGLKVKRDGDALHEADRSRGPATPRPTIRLRGAPAPRRPDVRRLPRPAAPGGVRASSEALANRSIAEPEEISQSAMAALFGHVWDSGDLGRNMRGGSGLLPDALGERARRRRPARLRGRDRCSLDGAGVRVRYAGPDGAGEIRARTAIVAVPAPHLPGMLGDA